MSIQGDKTALSWEDFGRLEGLTPKGVRKRIYRGKLTVISGPVGRNGKPVPMISIDQLSQAGLTRWVGEQTAKYQAAAELDSRFRGNDGQMEERREIERREMDRNRAALWGRYERATQRWKDVALKKVAAVVAVESLVKNGQGKMAAREAVVAQINRGPNGGTSGETSGGTSGGTPLPLCRLRASVESLSRWEAQVKNIDRADWVAALVDRYQGCLVEKQIDARDWARFRQLYLSLSAPKLTDCHYQVKLAAKADGREIACAETFRRRINQLPKAVRVLAREGEERLGEMYPPMERDKSTLQALEGVNGDGYIHNVAVRWFDGSIVRPVTVAWQDVYSGFRIAYRVDVTETAEGYRLGFMDLVRDFGIPTHVTIDNGRAPASKLLTGGVPTRFRFKTQADEPDGTFLLLGIQPENIHFTLPYNGRGKPIERGFRDMGDRIDRCKDFEGAYLGPNPMEKPENYGARAVPAEQFLEVLQRWWDLENQRPARRSKICAGRSFETTFLESYEKSIITRATQQQLQMLCLASEPITLNIRDAHIAFHGNRYWSEALADCTSRKVVIRYDPLNLHQRVFVFALDGTALCEAACIQAEGFYNSEAARVYARARNTYKRKQREIYQLETKLDALEAGTAPVLPAPSKKAFAKVVRPLLLATGTEGRSAKVEVRNEDDGELGELLEILRERQAEES